MAENTKTTKLKDRIKRSQEAVMRYPSWVRKSMIFHGGGVRREGDKRAL